MCNRRMTSCCERNYVCVSMRIRIIIRSYILIGVMIENHYDYLSVHLHISNRVIEWPLQFLVRENMELVLIGR